MSKYSLGLNFSHDTSACIIKDGKIYAVEEERWSGIKHNYNSSNEEDKFLFPAESLKYCLEKANISLEEIDTIIGVTLHPEYKLGDSNCVASLKELPIQIRNKIQFISHHESHVLSGFYLTKFDSSLGLCIDGAGSMLGVGFNHRERVSGFYLVGSEINRIYHLPPTYTRSGKKGELKEDKQSLGNFYKNFAIRVVPPGDEPEGTMMAMSSLNLGEIFYSEMKKKIKLLDNGLIHIEEGLGSRLPTGNIHIGGIDWNPNRVNKINFDIRCALASAVQRVFEESILHIINYLKSSTNCENLIFSGGCSLNSKLNGKILDLGNFRNVYIPPAPHDAGTAVGAALYGWCHVLKNKRPNQITCPDWGPDIGKIDIAGIEKRGYCVKKYDKFIDLAKKSALLLSENKIVFLVCGGMEFGPRALGHRSMLAHPGDIPTRDRLNKMKRRASFRPLAPSIIETEFKHWFTGDADYFMNKVAYVKKIKKEKIKGVIHNDGSARVQLIKKDNFVLYNILNEFNKITNIPIVINTSLNLKGKPIARSFHDVLKVFDELKPDALILDNILITKT